MILTRRFSQSDYDKYDWHKNKLVDKLCDGGWEAWVNGDQYGVDLLAWTRTGRLVTIDVEVKTQDWTCMEDFPFDTVRFTGRKKKFNHQGFIYVILSQNGKGGFYAPGSSIYRECNRRIVSVSRHGVRDNEDFYDVPVEEVSWFVF